MKYIVMKTNRGTYRVPLKLIAINRTKYYSEEKGFEKNSNEWKENINFIMDDDFEGVDWLTNNMNLSDIKPFMEKVEDVEDDEWFYNSDNFENNIS